MADNVELDPGTGGATVAADDIEGVLHQRVKAQFGEDGSATDVSLTDPLPVTNAVLQALIEATLAPGGEALTVVVEDGQVNVNKNPYGSGGATITSVADTATATNLLASQGARKYVSVTNTSSARLYVLMDDDGDGEVTSTRYSWSLDQHETWENEGYAGDLRGIWASDPGDGAALITESL